MTKPENLYPAKISKQFFQQRLLELLHRNTIDSYRLRALNPLLSMEEVRSVYNGLMEGRVKNEETLIASIQECVHLLKADKVLSFSSISKTFVIDEVLKTVKKENYRDLYVDVCHAIDALLEENTNYCHMLVQTLKILLDKPLPADPFLQLMDIDALLGSLVTDLIRLGYSKSYLFTVVRSKSDKFSESTFDEIFEFLETLTNRAKGKYMVWFSVNSPGLKEVDWAVFREWKVTTSVKEHSDVPFGKPARDRFYLGTQVDALDYFAALQDAKQIFSETLDIVKLAYHDRAIQIMERALVIDSNFPAGSKTHKVSHISDGKFPTGQEVLAKLRERLPLVLAKTSIKKETKEKIKSALRYLRYGNESIELEHQFINYWIGLEYLFSNERDSTFTRIKSIFPVLQLMVYLERNLVDFHRIIKKLPESEWEHFDATNAGCMIKPEVLQEIRDRIFEEHPLYAYRGWKILNHIVKRGTKEYLDNHKKHLEWHLIRIYRVRNEIVHEAKYSFQNQTLSSNLRYYLAFALSIILDHFSKNHHNTTDLETYFSLQIFKHKCLDYQNYPSEKLINMDYDFEMLS